MASSHETQFQKVVWAYYHSHGRHQLPWRQPELSGEFDPYKILVSELMLQQTQVSRVIPKYLAFLAQFPTVQALASTTLAGVLIAWQGLGYNRRAKYLWQSAQLITRQYNSEFPNSLAGLTALPGIGPGTAGAILAYSFNQPTSFAETNIRTAIIYHFFKNQIVVHDRDILKIVRRTLDKNSPRTWYWALTDYGAHLKQTVGNLSTQSKNYVKQSTFAGSNRQLRGQIIRALVNKPCSYDELNASLADARLPNVLAVLEDEGLISKNQSRYHLFSSS